MIQRIQSVYLFLAAVLSIVCLCMRIGVYDDGITVASRVYNLFSISANGDYSFSQWPLFVILLLSAAIGIYAIFAYSNRKLQAALCIFSVLLIVGWYIVFVVLAFTASTDKSFSPSLSVALPVLSIVFYILACRGIKSDERLVRAADRIR